MVIMFTYYGGQYFIMHGALHQSNLIYKVNKEIEGHKKSYWFDIVYSFELNIKNGTNRADKISLMFKVLYK